ncbi:MAG: type I restriction enzyme HsdR N-terminal domain-containing protein [Anaerolineales bacterium]|nr:type I restriction enzyme HsdR N-terminal domain-containing protein [Anaerolineales bacterium]
MDFIDRIRDLAGRIPRQLEYCKTEEATKNALIMPFINALGYDVFNPREVMPEYTADFGTKRGEKVDYAIFQDQKPIILFECKWSGADLGKEHASQLYRYFSVIPEVRFGVLTNGVEYHFYSDLEAPNRMDSKPFFVFNMLDFQDRHVEELKKFTKSAFNLDEILTTASELKYTAAIRRILEQEFEQPTDEFVIFLAKQVYAGRMTQSAKEQFGTITHKALRRFLSDQINERLKSALEETNREATAAPAIAETPQTPAPDPAGEVNAVGQKESARGIVTTEDEIEALFAIKSILRDLINPRRVHMRDTKSYCGILLDDNNRKPICRLHFNREQKYLGLFHEPNGEARVPINDVDDIYGYSGQIIATVSRYETQFGPPAGVNNTPPANTATGKLADSRASFTGKKLLAVHFQGKRYSANTWKDGMLAILRLVRTQKPGQFDSIAPTMVGRLRPYITTDSSLLRSAQAIPDTPYFVEANLSSQSIVRLCYEFLKKTGYKEADLAFEVE